MNRFAVIIRKKKIVDSEGFATEKDVPVATIHVYREGRHGTERWANLAAFSSATDLFRFRYIPRLKISTSDIIICEGDSFEIISVEDIRGRNMYLEVLAKKVEPTNG